MEKLPLQTWLAKQFKRKLRLAHSTKGPTEKLAICLCPGSFTNTQSGWMLLPYPTQFSWSRTCDHTSRRVYYDGETLGPPSSPRSDLNPRTASESRSPSILPGRHKGNAPQTCGWPSYCHYFASAQFLESFHTLPLARGNY